MVWAPFTFQPLPRELHVQETLLLSPHLAITNMLNCSLYRYSDTCITISPSCYNFGFTRSKRKPSLKLQYIVPCNDCLIWTYMYYVRSRCDIKLHTTSSLTAETILLIVPCRPCRASLVPTEPVGHVWRICTPIGPAALSGPAWLRM